MVRKQRRGVRWLQKSTSFSTSFKSNENKKRKHQTKPTCTTPSRSCWLQAVSAARASGRGWPVGVSGGKVNLAFTVRKITHAMDQSVKSSDQSRMQGPEAVCWTCTDSLEWQFWGRRNRKAGRGTLWAAGTEKGNKGNLRSFKMKEKF